MRHCSHAWPDPHRVRPRGGDVRHLARVLQRTCRARLPDWGRGADAGVARREPAHPRAHARAPVRPAGGGRDALAGDRDVRAPDGEPGGRGRVTVPTGPTPVSYTHLTLPTILRV